MTPQDDVAAIEAVLRGRLGTHEAVLNALAALDRLDARVRELEDEVDVLNEQSDGWQTEASNLEADRDAFADGYSTWEARALAAEAENARLREALGRQMDEGVERWHEEPNERPDHSLVSWLGLTDEQYAAWVERGLDGLLAALADPVEWPDGDEVGQSTCG